MKTVVSSIALFVALFSINAFASTDCSPKVENNQVQVEIFNADGQVVSTKKHAVSPVVFYTDLVWIDDATLEQLAQSSGSNKIIFGKKKKVKKLFRTVGKKRTAHQENGSPIVSIGGCPQQKVNLANFRSKYPEKPFVGKNFIPATAPAQVVKPSSNKVSKSVSQAQEVPVRQVSTSGSKPKIQNTLLRSKTIFHETDCGIAIVNPLDQAYVFTHMGFHQISGLKRGKKSSLLLDNDNMYLGVIDENDDLWSCSVSLCNVANGRRTSININARCGQIYARQTALGSYPFKAKSIYVENGKLYAKSKEGELKEVASKSTKAKGRRDYSHTRKIIRPSKDTNIIFGTSVNNTFPTFSKKGEIFYIVDGKKEIWIKDVKEIIGIGGAYVVALKNDGSVWSWGTNSQLHLGDGTDVDKVKPVKVKNLKNVISLHRINNANLAAQKDGSVLIWGRIDKGLAWGGNPDNLVVSERISTVPQKVSFPLTKTAFNFKQNYKKLDDVKTVQVKSNPKNIKDPEVKTGSLAPFGIPLGVPFNKNYVSKVKGESVKDGYRYFSVIPKKANSNFQSYNVAASISDNTVYQVQAHGGCKKGKSNCADTANQIVNALEKKYGKPRKRNLSKGTAFFNLDVENRAVQRGEKNGSTVRIGRLGPMLLQLKYTDSKSYAKAKLQRKEYLTKKVKGQGGDDATGL